jgi:hypothetical protein
MGRSKIGRSEIGRSGNGRSEIGRCTDLHCRKYSMKGKSGKLL